MSFSPAGKAAVNRRYTLGILTTLQKNIFHSHYHAELLSGIFSKTATTGCDLKIIAWPPEGYPDLPSIFYEHSLDGLLVLTWRWIHPRFVKLIENAHENRVLVVNDFKSGLDVNAVYTDVMTGMRAAVKYLAKKKMRQIGMIHGPETVLFKVNGTKQKVPFIDTELKRQALMSALKAQKIPVKKDWIRAAAANSEDEGFRVMKCWLRTKKVPRAILCGNDDLAFGAIKAIREAGFACPKDFAVIGFDDNHQAKASQPALTTVRQPLREMGSDAVDILLDQIRKPKGCSIQRSYQPKVIIRKSA